jgi:hypothetical protein
LQFASKNFLGMQNEILVPHFENKSPQIWKNKNHVLTELGSNNK